MAKRISSTEDLTFWNSEEGRVIFAELLDKFNLVETEKPEITRQAVNYHMSGFREGYMLDEKRDQIKGYIFLAEKAYKIYRNAIKEILSR